MGGSQDWFIMEKKPIKIDDLGGYPILGNLHIIIYRYIFLIVVCCRHSY